MFGSATLTIVVSMISSKVAAITAMLTMARRRPCSTTFLGSTMFICSGLSHLDRGFDAHAGTQRHVGAHIVDRDAHRNALRHFDEVTRRVLRRNECVRILRGRVDRDQV